MTAAISADPLGVLIAFGAGILSFLSPCVLPLVPGYLSMVSGLSAAELATIGVRQSAAVAVTAGGISAQSPAPAPAPAAPMRPMLRGIGLFVAGFTIVFVALGAAASSIGRLLDAHELLLSHVSGVVVVLLGLVLVVGALPGRVWSQVGAVPLRVVTRLSGERRFTVQPSTLGTWAAPVMGMAFAFAWTPCIGPVLSGVLSLAAKNGTLPGGVLLLFAYSLGLAVPFVAAGLAFGRLTTLLVRVRSRLWMIELAAGLILIVFGVLLLTNNVAWLSAQISAWLNDVGLGRLSKS